jgi:hypothetical protein
MSKSESLQSRQSETTKRSSSENLKVLFALAIVFPLLGGWLAWDEGSLLARDFSIGEDLGTLQAATDFRLVEGSCKSKLVLTWCDIKAHDSSGSEAREVKLHYTFFDVHTGKYSIRLLKTRSNPPLLTSDMGQENLWNRAVTLAALLLFLFFWPFYFVYVWKKRRRERQPVL